MTSLSSSDGVPRQGGAAWRSDSGAAAVHRVVALRGPLTGLAAAWTSIGSAATPAARPTALPGNLSGVPLSIHAAVRVCVAGCSLGRTDCPGAGARSRGITACPRPMTDRRRDSTNSPEPASQSTIAASCSRMPDRWRVKTRPKARALSDSGSHRGRPVGDTLEYDDLGAGTCVSGPRLHDYLKRDARLKLSCWTSNQPEISFVGQGETFLAGGG
jgi:hypothetical protein